MYIKSKYKKILSTLLVIAFFSISVLPVFCTETIYDFSDEAQAKFDAQSNVKQSTPIIDHTKLEKEKKKVKKRKQKKTKTTEEAKTEEVIQEEINKINPTSLPVFQPEIKISDDLSQNTLKGNIVYIPAGASFKGVLQSSISSASLDKNDTIAAVLYSDWYYNNVLIAPQGSILYGKALEAKQAGFAYANGSLSITFNEILTPKGDSIKLESNIVTVVVESQRAKKIATNVIGGAIMGLVSGVLYALITGGNVVNGMAIGSGVGAGGGAIRAATNKGEEVEVPAGTSIDIRLTKPMNATPYN